MSEHKQGLPSNSRFQSPSPPPSQEAEGRNKPFSDKHRPVHSFYSRDSLQKGTCRAIRQEEAGNGLLHKPEIHLGVQPLGGWLRGTHRCLKLGNNGAQGWEFTALISIHFQHLPGHAWSQIYLASPHQEHAGGRAQSLLP